MTAPPNAHDKSVLQTRNNDILSEEFLKCKHFFLIFKNICHLSSLQQKNSSYAARRHRMMHSTSTNKLGSQMLISTPTASQNKAKPATRFIGNRPSRKASSFYSYASLQPDRTGAAIFLPPLPRPGCRSDPPLTSFRFPWM